MRVAVGGGRGFIGRAVVRALDAAAIDAVAFGREGAPAGPIDALVWAAGTRAPDDAANRAAHVDAPIAAAQALGARTIVYLSSGEIYGAAPVPFVEDGPIAPPSSYARAKRAGELEIRAERLFVLRPGIVYGPEQSIGPVVPSVAAALRARRTIALTAGAQTRDFVWVDDLAALILRCLGGDAPPGIYNAGTGREVSVRDACLLLAAAHGAHREALLDFGALPYRPDEQMRYVLDPSCAADRLGWRAQVTLEDGLARLAATSR